MGLACNSEFIFIGKGDESFLENYSYELNEDPEGQGGKISMALEIVNNQADAENIGEAVFSTFKKKFYEDIAAAPFDRFEAALKEVNAVINALKEEKVSRFIGNLNVALAAVSGESLYLSTAGDAEVYLVRKRFVSIISEGLAEESKDEMFANIANGVLESEDRVVLSSTRLLRYITKGELGRIFGDSRSLADALTKLQDFIMTEILGRSAVIGLEMEEQVEQSEQAERSEALKLTKILSFLHLPKFPTGRFSTLRSMGQRLRGLLPSKLSLPKAPQIPPIHFHDRMSKKRVLLLVVLLVLVLVFGTFWLRTRGNQKREIAEQQAKLNHARELMNDAVTAGQFDKLKASDLLSSADTQAREVLNSNFLRSEAVRVLDDIKNNRDTLDEVKRIKNPTLVADFSEKRATVNALGLLGLKDRLYGFEFNALYEMVLDKLQDPLQISDLETVILGTDFTDQNVLLFLTRTGKMIQFKDARFSLVATKDGIWKKGADMKTYRDRLYLLDAERNQIWRYTKAREGFESGEAYNQDADLKNGVSLAIDASVYVLNGDGIITQLYQGQKKDFPIRRPPMSPLVAPTRIFTNPDLNHLYILEPGKNRVVLLRKDPKNGGAQYNTQYVFEGTGTLRDFVVSDNRLYVMDEKRVYFVNLSGL